MITEKRITYPVRRITRCLKKRKSLFCAPIIPAAARWGGPAAAARGDQFEVFSSGLYPAEIHPMTLKVLDEAGIDTSPLEI